MLKKVYALDEGYDFGYLFTADTGAEAINKMLYILNVRNYDPNAHVETIGKGRTLTLCHHGLTYACLND